MEIDVAWAAAGGEDPVELINANAGRVVRLHLKDSPMRPANGEMVTNFSTVPVGQGVLGWHATIKAARRAGVGGAYVEVEFPHARAPVIELAESRNYLRSL